MLHTRRRILHVAAGAALLSAPVIRSLAEARQPQTGMTLGFSTYAMKSLKPIAAIEAIAKIGYDAVELHGARWRTRKEPGVLSDRRVLAFHRAAISCLAAEGVVRLYGLRVAERLAATYYGFLDRGRAYVYLTGFDPTFSFESPGTLLLGHAINEAWRMGAREFHFLRGAEKYKYTWGAVDRFNQRRVFERAAAPARA